MQQTRCNLRIAHVLGHFVTAHAAASAAVSENGTAISNDVAATTQVASKMKKGTKKTKKRSPPSPYAVFIGEQAARYAAASSSSPSSSPSSPAPSTSSVLSRVHANGCGCIILNRPRALNALSMDMITELLRLLTCWQDDDRVRIVIIVGIGRAFCAGGDIGALSSAEPGSNYGHIFFKAEFTMNALLAQYRKPVVSVMHGVVMGGGVGLSIHGRYRVVTDDTRFAMPETGIGLFPDVGGSFFLPRLVGETGLYLGLTGAIASVGDCMYAGIGTHFVGGTRLVGLVRTLTTAALPPLHIGDAGVDRAAVDACVERILAQHAPLHPTKLPSMLRTHRAVIDRCFTATSLPQVISQLTQCARGAGDDHRWTGGVLRVLASKSPISRELAFATFMYGRHQCRTLREALQMEFHIAVRLVENDFNTSDFAEGVRAVIVDKDHNPRWKPLGGDDAAAVERRRELVARYMAPFTRARRTELFDAVQMAMR